jgi:calcium binding protein 39
VTRTYARSDAVSEDVVALLLEGYRDPDLAVHTGLCLRELAKHRSIVEAFFGRRDLLQQACRYGAAANVDVATDAFATLREFLVGSHKKVAAKFAVEHFENFFSCFHTLLTSSEYFTLRLTLRLLSEILVDKAYLDSMLLYVGNVEYLKIHMDFLRNKSKAIRQDAFHIFKVFAANPRKPPKVEHILVQNRERLVALLTTGLVDEDDESFEADKHAVLTKIAALKGQREQPGQEEESALPVRVT